MALLTPFWLTALALAADDKPEWSIDDLLKSERAAGFVFSPDGSMLAWTQSALHGDDKRHAHIYLYHTSQKQRIQLTRGFHSHRSLRFSTDGRYLSFLSNRPLPKKKDKAAKTQLFLMDPRGGEPWPITSFERGIRGYQWRDANRIVFSAQEDATHEESSRKKQKDTTRVVDDEEHEPPVALVRVRHRQEEDAPAHDEFRSRSELRGVARRALLRRRSCAQPALRIRPENPAGHVPA